MKRCRILPALTALALCWVLMSAMAAGADYWLCPGCGKRVSELVGDLCPYCGYERHVHTWQPATCVRPKTCAVCGETEGSPDPENHTGATELRGRKTAGCTLAGYTGDVFCADCGQRLEEGRVIPAPGHQWEGSRVIREATCIEKGLREFVCAACGLTMTLETEIDPDHHAGATALRDDRAPTCGTPGYTGDTYCLDCNQRVITGRALPATGLHDWQAATCTAPKTCRVCSATEGEPAGHQWGAGILVHPATCSFEGLKRYTCAVCGKTKNEILPADPERHTWDGGVLRYPATCAAEGMSRYTCTECGTTEIRVLPVDPSNHTGGRILRNDRPAGCETAGYTGDTYCAGCGALIKTGEVLPATGHDWQEATRQVPKTCRLCGRTEGTPLALKAGDTVTFGCYEQDNRKGNGKEPIEWLVLDIDTAGHKALLISLYGLDTQPYHYTHRSVTWEQCSLRKWLNSDFLNTAFTRPEQYVIMVTQVRNASDQGYWNISGGNNTLDKLFLLSYAEANRYSDVALKYETNASSRVTPTAYAKARGAAVNTGTASGPWWLRSPGNRGDHAASVATNGSLQTTSVSSASICVRPAMWVNLQSGIIQ